ncbi:polysaccharide biosynthesis tyrosine autokinase [Oceanomicrobium pacificus]|uniref:non-specific protein-tyrosine kinase n=1 Tax=Oceanomicrobium pacificus TaxID=2692916 RepID=A0A6B0U1U7_9RHOB|nr:polysaccharide biosynthesis tyrosine autokinase [Oceanomicrobium pacificus]MXU65061.1 polysaccharide biosynthesis tyrosine autokinase [Oceanomicrobium pacificus]
MNKPDQSYRGVAPSTIPDGRPVDDDEIDLLALLNSLWRGKWIILAATIACLCGGIYYAFVHATPVYTSTTVIALDNRDQTPLLDIASVMSGLSGDQATINTETEVLRSRNLAGRLVEDLGLLEDPEFNRSLQPVSPYAPNALIATALVALGLREAEAGPPPLEKQFTDTTSQLLDATSVSNARDSYAFRVSATTEEPRKSAAIADRLAEIYIDDQMRVKFEATEQAAKWLTERAAELRVTLEASEEEAKRFNAETDLVSPQALEGLNRQLKDMRDRLVDAEVALAAAESRSADIAAATSAGDVAAAATTLDDPILRALLQSGDGAPDQSEKLQARLSQLQAQAALDVQRRTRTVQTLEASVSDLSDQVAKQGGDLVRLEQLRREVEANRMIYENFLIRLREISVQQGLQTPDARIISAAVVPTVPSAPKKARILALSALFGLILGIGLVLLREMRAKGFRTAQELEQETSLPVLGEIPLMPVRRRNRILNYIISKPASPAAESARNLRTSVELSSAGAPPQVILSTSCLPGESKTTTSLLLAHHFARLGRKVLLIECDVRRKVMTTYFPEAEPVLVDVIQGVRPLQDAVHSDPALGIDVLPGQSAEVNAADLFSSKAFRTFIAQAREEYDHIIIDTPPVLLVADARLIAHEADAVLLNVKWDSTTRQQVAQALRAFETARVKVQGLVLTQVDYKGMRRYGYGKSYGGYSYQSSGYYKN